MLRKIVTDLTTRARIMIILFRFSRSEPQRMRGQFSGAIETLLKTCLKPNRATHRIGVGVIPFYKIHIPTPHLCCRAREMKSERKRERSIAYAIRAMVKSRQCRTAVSQPYYSNGHFSIAYLPRSSIAAVRAWATVSHATSREPSFAFTNHDCIASAIYNTMRCNFASVFHRWRCRVQPSTIASSLPCISTVIVPIRSVAQ